MPYFMCILYKKQFFFSKCQITGMQNIARLWITFKTRIQYRYDL